MSQPTLSDPQAECDLRARNLLYLTTPSLWPDGPALPLVRRTPAGTELGVLYPKPGYETTVFLANLFMLPTTEEEFFQLPKEVYKSAEEIYEAGWRVD